MIAWKWAAIAAVTAAAIAYIGLGRPEKQAPAEWPDLSKVIVSTAPPPVEILSSTKLASGATFSVLRVNTKPFPYLCFVTESTQLVMQCETDLPSPRKAP